jgi:hypothetical protein
MDLRLAGQPVGDRLVSISDPDARPIRKGKLRQPTEFGYVMQLTSTRSPKSAPRAARPPRPA